jgi:chemotaxis family two-component system sensor kinase Cph1
LLLFFKKEGLPFSALKPTRPSRAPRTGDQHVQSDVIQFATCADEPIQFPGSIQPHGWLITFTPAGVVTHVSANLLTLTGQTEQACLGGRIEAALPVGAQSCIAGWLGWASQPEGGFVCRFVHAGAELRGFAHRAGDSLIFELEPCGSVPSGRTDSLQAEMLEFSRAAEDISDWRHLASLAARVARRCSRFDRVLVYRFDRDFNGSVVAEDGNGILPSYIDLQFPADDIPAQARDLYRRNRLRMIPDAAYTAIPILPACASDAAAPLDLRQAALRSVSPLHLAYMRNMGTSASMSASLIVEGQLWGLMSFHSRDPHYVDLPVRSAMEFLAQMLSGGLAARAHAEQAKLLQTAQTHHDHLLAAMAAATSPRPQSLADEAADLLALTNADGAAILTETDCLCIGTTPKEAVLRRLARWLGERREPGIFVTENLAASWPGGEAHAATASGVLAAGISELHPSYVMWFRSEWVHTRDWAGPPGKSPGEGETGHGLSPRSSFAVWQEQVRRRSRPWTTNEIEAARRMRAAITGVVLRRAEELAGLSYELTRTNKELEAFSYSISHDLRAPFRHIVGYAELLRENIGAGLAATDARFLQTIIDSAMSAGQLVDDLLHFSRLGRAALTPGRVNMAKLLEEARRSLEMEAAGRAIEWRIGDMPEAWGDQSLLRQALINLLSNAQKYARTRTPAVIEVWGEQSRDATRYTIRDNGVGFDMAYAGKLFGVFQRLHLAEHYEGTGIGLALTRRIVERHGGDITALGEPGQGATFSFTLPRQRADGVRTGPPV